MMKVVGEEGTSVDDYIIYQKGELIDAAYLQQNSFDPVDYAAPPERQKDMFDVLYDILMSSFALETKSDVRVFFNEVRQAFLDWNGIAADSSAYEEGKKKLVEIYKAKVRS